MDGLTEGRFVHYVMADGQHRPAQVVRVWGTDGVVNLVVTLDGSNDRGSTPYPLAKDVKADPHEGQQHQVDPLHWWATSVRYSEAAEPGTWHWIERA